MATNLDLNDELVEEARRIGRHRTKKAAVTEALKEYIQHQRQLEIFELIGQVDYDDDYDYKAERRRETPQW